jgi:glycosyltransferase involved in cell wall biosynthesis
MPARRVTVIAHELRGLQPVGGMGTATSFLAIALARLGHSVDILLGKHSPEAIDPDWQALYDQAGVRIRPVPRTEEAVEPWHFAHAHAVSLGLQETPPDVVIAHDFGAPAYAALRLRQAGIAFEDTLFVVYCHGPRRWIADISANIGIGDLQTVLGVSTLEQASVELADVVVSPSAYLLDWMRERGWQLPYRTHVIPLFTRSEATGEPAPTASRPDPDPLLRLSFFGRVDERKGVRLLAAALNQLEADQLRGVELEFVGKTTPLWPPQRVAGLLTNETKQALRNISFLTEFDQPEALAHLRRPGTLAVIPSLHDNSPSTIYECLEEGIPFIASTAGGVPELIAAEHRADVLFEPSADDLAATLRRVLDNGNAPAPAQRGFDRAEVAHQWTVVIELNPQRHATVRDTGNEHVDVIVVRRTSQEALQRCVAALKEQSHANLDIIVADTRQAGVDQAAAPYVVFLDEEDVPETGFVKTLLAVQQATGADVVTCGLRLENRLQFFSGDPGGLGAVTNAYGNVALYARALLGDVANAPPGTRDPDWPLLARLAAGGATIVSIPLPLVRRRTAPGSAHDDPAAALEVVRQLEQALPGPLRGVARIAAGLAARG